MVRVSENGPAPAPGGKSWQRRPPVSIAHLLGGARTEETRVAYVALTRAERYVAIALPAQTPDEVVEAYVAAGFTLIDESSTGIDLQ
jgi:hypothetical protein